MSFLYAGALGLGLLAVVPLILHFRRRHTDRRVAFPALRYLTHAEDARSRSLRASDLVLLAVRIGLLLALALAAAGPLLGRGGPADHVPTDVAILIDNSASAGALAEGRPLLDHFADRAREALGAARPEDRFWIVPSVGPAAAAGVGGARAAEALERVGPTAGRGDLSSDLRRAAAMVPTEEGRRREIHLLSDLQATGLGDAASEGPGLPVVTYLAPPGPRVNGAVAEARPTGGTTVPTGVGHGVVVRPVRLGGASAAGPDSGTAALRLEVDGRIAGASRTPWGAAVTIGLPELSPGTHAGRVEVEPEGLRADDERYFALQVVEPPSVRLTAPPGSFLLQGVETLRDAGRLGDGPPTVHVLEEAPPTGAPPRAGTLVLVPPRDPVDLPAFNQLLERAGAGWVARLDPARGTLRLSGGGTALPLDDLGIRLRYLLRRSEGVPGGSDTTLLATPDGEPWLVRSRAGERTYLILGSPLDASASDLPTSPLMIPFLEALLVQWSHLATWPPSAFEAGSAVSLPAWADSITTPDGTRVTVEPGSRYTPFDAGVYLVRGRRRGAETAPERTAAFAVNVPEGELDPTRADPSALAELFPAHEVITAGPDAAAWERAIYRARRGRDAAPWLLVLAVGLAATELLLATPGRASGRRPDAASGTGRVPR